MTSSVGILNQTHDNLEKRIARIEAQLGRPRSCKYGTTTERTSYGAPVEGILWWDTTEEVLYVWYDYNWILAKGVMVGGTMEREATSLPTAGGMWWDTDEDNLYVWGVSNSWQSVTGAKFGTREQRDAGGFPGCIWMCTDEGYASVYHPDGYWLGIGDSVADLNWLWSPRYSEFAVMGHRTTGTQYILYDTHTKMVQKFCSSGALSKLGTEVSATPVVFGQDGLVPYADFSNGQEWPYLSSVSCGLNHAGYLYKDSNYHTIMIWFKIHEQSLWPQPIIGVHGFNSMPWLLYVGGTMYRFPETPQTGCPGRLGWMNQDGGPSVSTDTWHFAAVRNGCFKMDDGEWSTVCQSPEMDYDMHGYISHSAMWYNNYYHWAWLHLHGRVSMYYVNGRVGLTEGQIDMFYERTRRLHGV